MIFNKLKFIINYLSYQYYLKRVIPSQFKNVELKGNNHIVQSTIGEYSYIALNSIVSHTHIGKFCSIGPNVVIGYGDHPTNYLSTSPLVYFREIFPEITDKNKLKYFDSHKQTVIKNDVWIGANCYIKNGITIGDGAIIAAGAVVTRDVLPYEIVGGLPAKHIRYRFSEDIRIKLLKLAWWDWSIEKIKKIEPYLSIEIDNNVVSLIEEKQV